MNFDAIFKNVKIFKIGPLEGKLQRFCGFLFWAFHKLYGIDHSYTVSENLLCSPVAGNFQSFY